MAVLLTDIKYTLCPTTSSVQEKIETAPKKSVWFNDASSRVSDPSYLVTNQSSRNSNFINETSPIQSTQPISPETPNTTSPVFETSNIGNNDAIVALSLNQGNLNYFSTASGSINKSTSVRFENDFKSSVKSKIGSSVSRKVKSFVLKISDVSQKVTVSRRLSVIRNDENKKSRMAQKEFNSFKSGKDSKDLSSLFLKTTLSPAIFFGKGLEESGFISNESFFFNNELQQLNFGQGFFSDRGDKNDTFKVSPFIDFPGKIDAKTIVENGGDYSAFPVVNDTIIDYQNYRDELANQTDGIVKIFESKFKSSIYVESLRGIKGGFGLDNYFSSLKNQVSSNILDDKTPNDGQQYFSVFLDSQEGAFSSHFFPRVGSSSSSGFVFSQQGISNPIDSKINYFEDRTPADLKSSTYSTLSVSLNLISSSNRDISEIGTLFKSSNAGCIIHPNYQDRILTTLGTDSIAFSGMFK